MRIAATSAVIERSMCHGALSRDNNIVARIGTVLMGDTVATVHDYHAQSELCQCALHHVELSAKHIPYSLCVFCFVRR